jgi:hypothetical protein
VVIRISGGPYSYFHLAYPTGVEHHDVRQAERIAVSIPVVVSTATGGTVNAYLRDLSSLGALIMSTDSIGLPNDTVQLAFELTLGEIHRSFQLAASIRNTDVVTAPPSEASQYRHGVRFGSLPEADSFFLLAYVYERRISGGTYVRQA